MTSAGPGEPPAPGPAADGPAAADPAPLRVFRRATGRRSRPEAAPAPPGPAEEEEEEEGPEPSAGAPHPAAPGSSSPGGPGPQTQLDHRLALAESGPAAEPSQVGETRTQAAAPPPSAGAAASRFLDTKAADSSGALSGSSGSSLSDSLDSGALEEEVEALTQPGALAARGGGAVTSPLKGSEGAGPPADDAGPVDSDDEEALAALQARAAGAAADRPELSDEELDEEQQEQDLEEQRARRDVADLEGIGRGFEPVIKPLSLIVNKLKERAQKARGRKPLPVSTADITDVGQYYEQIKSMAKETAALGAAGAARVFTLVQAAPAPAGGAEAEPEPVGEPSGALLTATEDGSEDADEQGALRADEVTGPPPEGGVGRSPPKKSFPLFEVRGKGEGADGEGEDGAAIFFDEEEEEAVLHELEEDEPVEEEALEEGEEEEDEDEEESSEVNREEEEEEEEDNAFTWQQEEPGLPEGAPGAAPSPAKPRKQVTRTKVTNRVMDAAGGFVDVEAELSEDEGGGYVASDDEDEAGDDNVNAEGDLKDLIGKNKRVSAAEAEKLAKVHAKWMEEQNEKAIDDVIDNINKGFGRGGRNEDGDDEYEARRRRVIQQGQIGAKENRIKFNIFDDRPDGDEANLPEEDRREAEAAVRAARARKEEWKKQQDSSKETDNVRGGPAGEARTPPDPAPKAPKAWMSADQIEADLGDLAKKKPQHRGPHFLGLKRKEVDPREAEKVVMERTVSGRSFVFQRAADTAAEGGAPKKRSRLGKDKRRPLSSIFSQTQKSPSQNMLAVMDRGDPQRPSLLSPSKGGAKDKNDLSRALRFTIYE